MGGRAGNQVGVTGATALAASLAKKTTLTNLDVYGNDVGAAGATALAASLEKNTSLTSLNVSRNLVGVAGANVLAANLEKNTTLTSLNVAGNLVGVAGTTVLAARLEKNTTLTSLDVSNNGIIRDDVQDAIGTALESNRCQPKWNVMLGLRLGWGGFACSNPASGRLCIAAAPSSSLACLLNQVFMKVDEYLRSSTGSISSPGVPFVRWRRRITRSQLRFLGGKSLEPFACGTDDPAFVRDGKCALSTPFGVPVRSWSTNCGSAGCLFAPQQQPQCPWHSRHVRSPQTARIEHQWRRAAATFAQR